MSFEQDFIHSYEKHAEHFDKLAKKAYPILGNITQCGLVEVDSSGHILHAANRPDYGECYIDKKGYLLDKNLTYSPNSPEGFFTLSTNDGIQFLQSNEKMLFGKNFNVWNGFIFSERIDDHSRRYYFFTFDTPEIYDKLPNDILLIKKFIEHFKKESQHIIDYFKNHKINLAKEKDNYFINDNDDISYSERERLVSMLHTLEVLDKCDNITNKEWQCLELYYQGRSASQTGEILGISRRTVETYFDRLKKKLKVSSKSELIDTLN